VDNPFAKDSQFTKDSIQIQVAAATAIIIKDIEASSFRKDFIDSQKSELIKEGIITA
jgi:hypothetical protein